MRVINMTELRRITEVPVTCHLCGWESVVYNCLAGDDGELLCGRCASYDLEFHNLPHEISTDGK